MGLNVKIMDDKYLLLVEDDELLGKAYQNFLEEDELHVQHVSSAAGAWHAIETQTPEVLLLDLLLPDGHGLDLLKKITDQRLPITVVVVTTEASAQSALDAMQAGAFDYLVKPVDKNRLITTVHNACERQILQQDLDQFRSIRLADRFQHFIGGSQAMQTVYRLIEGAAASLANVFITGESGTGKELCAEAIHQLSARRSKALITINCAAIPRELLESELFGHTKGAFSGATSDRKGAAAQANGGTLFFDEICEMDLDLQAKLLRFIQSKRFRKVGSDKEEIADVRFICATNRDPLTEVNAGRFREDLYYRLHVIPIEIPPLRNRAGDVLQLAQFFLHRYAAEENKRFDGFSADAEKALLTYRWPGNVRHLQNLIHKLVVINDGGRVDAKHLDIPSNHIDEIEQSTLNSSETKNRIHSVLDSSTIKPLWLEEKAIIERAINLCNGNIIEAAKQLEVSDSTIYRKRQKWNKVN